MLEPLDQVIARYVLYIAKLEAELRQKDEEIKKLKAGGDT